MNANIKIKPITPRVPNFIRSEEGHQLSVSEYSDSTLRQIALNWGENLIKRKNEILNQKK